MRINFLQCSRGATAIEYGLIIALIALVMLVGLTTLGGDNENKYDYLSDKVGEATSRNQ